MSTTVGPEPIETERQAGAYHSPPDSNSERHPKAESDSELSDLEDAAEDIGEIEPHHYQDEGRIPVFKPTRDQFKDFTLFMDKINTYGMRSGIVKVLPPPEWKAELPRLDQAVKTIRIKEPIKQDIMGTAGTYRQANILHGRSLNLVQWKQLCEQSEHQPPAKRGERRANQDKPSKSATKAKAVVNSSAPKSKKKGAIKGKAKLDDAQKDNSESISDRLPTPMSPIDQMEDEIESVKQEPDDEESGTPSKSKGGRQPKSVSVSSRRKYNRREAAAKIDEEAFKDFKYELEGEEYTPERCEELERAYWKTLTYAPPLYGADMPGTLFDDRTKTWNLGKLDNILDVLGSKIPGVNTAYLYLGMWKATFAWHLEDVDLYSINYLHFGAPKQWYSISQGDARRFEAAMKSIWPADAKACDQFLRHKTFLISPAHLWQNFKIKVNKIVHHPGEFVITFPYGYHSGYNLGYNCAEAVNFALESWLPYGRVAKKCDCSQAQDSVWIDVHEIERKLRGEETEFEETDDEEDEDEDLGPTDLPTPPNSNGNAKVKASSKKRKRPIGEAADKANPNAKKIRVRIRASAKEPCILCPNDIPSESLLPTEQGQKAHRICALYIPETSIDEEGNGEIVTDIPYINKARLDLKCNYCRSKKGACFQCSQKKCTRAYHATCAAAAGVLVEQGDAPVFGEDGTEYKYWALEFSCRFHRTKRDKKLDGDALGENERILKAGQELEVGVVCQMQFLKGEIFAGVVVENRKTEEMLLVDILPKGDRVEVEYRWLLVPDPADYHIVKPSANAIPLPKSRKDKESLNTSKRQVDDIPRADDPFVPGFTWSEFKNENITPNPFQVKIDFAKENQVWFYLGKTSTEAKAQFTEDPSQPRHNPKGHFLDTIPKPQPQPRQSYAASYPSKPRPSAATPQKPLVRPSEAANAARTEKPYVYKPRIGEESYRVDPQAYNSQQTFLQRSAPYTFGTDPRWRTGEAPAITPFTKPASTSSSLPRSTPSPLMAPPPTHYRPTYSAPPKPQNPFGSRQQNYKPNPFMRYAYLQKEHNRSPHEYKSPYMVGGGFMNGYEGNLQKHIQQTLLQNRPGMGSGLSNILLSYGSGSRTVHTSTPTSYGEKSTSSDHGLHSIPTPENHNGQEVPSSISSHQSAWEKKDTSELHPAIRKESINMFHRQYQTPRTTAQYQSATAHPSYGQHTYGASPRSQSEAQPHRQQSPQTAAHIKQSPPYQQHSRPLQAQPPHSQTTQSYQTQTQPQNNSFQSRPASQVSQLNPTQPHVHRESAQTRTSQPDQAQSHISRNPASTMISTMNTQATTSLLPLPAVQVPQQDKAPVYAHQQYFQTQQCQLPPPQATASMYQPRDLPDVPVDSNSLIERMMMNLKKATYGPSAGGSS